MSQPTALSDSPPFGTRHIDPERLAWGVLLLSFAIFCILAVAAIVGVDYFLFQSAVPIQSTLSLGRGTVGIMELSNSIEQVGRNGDMLTTGMVISTDLQSQGDIRFVDSQDDNSLIASITLNNNSVVTLRQASRPRYEWSRTRHIIDLGNVSGRLTIYAPHHDNRDLLINIETSAGAIVNLEGGGHYTINASSDQLNVANRDGKVTFIPSDLRQGHSIPVDGLGIINNQDNSVAQKPGYVDLLKDVNFSTLYGGPADAQVWSCGNDPNDDPPGLYDFVPQDGEMVLRFVRGEGATTHGRTSCTQSFGQAGLDIVGAGYNSLILHATFYIEYQSLDACGFEGSECPLTLRMDYLDSNHVGQQWFHGFYTREADPQANYKLRCSSCPQDHDLISEKAWYTYESPNLLALLTETVANPDDPTTTMEVSPASIVGMIFYASGHQFDVRIEEMALIAAHLDNAETATVDEVAGQDTGQ